MSSKPVTIVCLGAFLLGASGCSGGPPRAYVGPKRPATAIANIESSSVLSILEVQPREKIEGFDGSGEKEWNRPGGIELLPGSYEIVTTLWKSSLDKRHGRNQPTAGETAAKIAAGIALNILTLGALTAIKSGGSDRACDGNRLVLDARPGRFYRVDGEHIDSVCWLWAEDTKSGEVVAGTKPTTTSK